MKLIKKSDILLISGIILLAVIIWAAFRLLSSSDGMKAEIYYKSQLIKTVDLDKPKEHSFSVSGHENVVFHVYANGEIAFEDSDCPDKVCINTGKLGRSGQSAACLPNDIIMKILPKGEHKADDADIIN